MRKASNKKNIQSKIFLSLFALILFPILFSTITLAAQDFIIENRTSALFIVNGTTGNIIMAPVFGKVGIGTLNPGLSLTVVGNVSISGNLSVGGNFSVNRNNLFVDITSGNVGIGTTTPNQKLTVIGSINATGNITAGNSTIILDSTNNRIGIGTTLPTHALDVQGNVSIKGNLSVDSNVSIDGSTFFVDSTGNFVGIGTTSPSDTLTVIGSLVTLGSLNATFINATEIRKGGNIVQEEGIAFKISNYSGEYDRSGFKRANITEFFGDAGFNGSVLRVGNMSSIRESAYNLANFTSNLNTQNASLWNRSGTNTILRFISDNVGIGTITPDNKLTIGGTDADANLATIGLLHLNITDNYNTSVTNFITLDHSIDNPVNSTGGIGLGILFRAVTNYSKLANVSFINATLVNTYNGSEASALTFYTRRAGGKLNASLVLNGSDVFVAPNGGNTYLNPSSGNVGIGTTSPQNRLEVIGAATFAGGVNASSLNVTGFSITDDSLVTLSDGSKKKIRDIKAGEEVLTLDEKTGKLVPRKVNALLDHGIKPIYQMATEDGRAINTTAEHPYFVRGGGYIRNLNGVSTNNLPLKSDGLTLSNKSDNAAVTVLMTGGAILMNTIPSCFSGGNKSMLPKCLSNDNITLPSAFAISDTNSSLDSRGALLISKPLPAKNSITNFGIFSSARSFNLPDSDIFFLLEQLGGIVNNGQDGSSRELREVVYHNLFRGYASAYQGEGLPNHYPSSFESKLPMADFTVSNDKLINFGSHKIDNNYEVYKDYENHAQWLEVKYLKVGDEIAVPDYSTGAIKWVKIASIKTLEPQHVYDLSIEGTRNFIANDIVAHNTYLATSSGNVGIGTTGPDVKLEVVGADALPSTSGLAAGNSIVRFKVTGDPTVLDIGGGSAGKTWLQSRRDDDYSSNFPLLLNPNGGNVGIGTTSPLSTLHINNSGADGALRVTNVSGTTIFFVNGSSGNVGIGTTSPGQRLELAGGNILINNTANAFLNLSGPIMRKSGDDIVISD